MDPTIAERDADIEAQFRAGRNCQEIGAALSPPLSRERVRQVLKRRGVSRAARDAAIRDRFETCRTDIERCIGAGEKPTDIARRMGFPAKLMIESFRGSIHALRFEGSGKAALRRAVVDAYAHSSESLNALSARFGFGPNYIVALARKAGVKPRRKGARTREERRAKREAIERDLIASGLSQTAIAAKYGVSPNRVYQIARGFAAFRERQSVERRELQVKRDAITLDLLAGDLSCVEISARHGVSLSGVYQLSARLKRTTRANT